MSDKASFFEKSMWTAGIVGLGYVGLPFAVAAAKEGLGVIGLDTSDDVVAGLRAGESHIDDVSEPELARAIEAGAMFTSDARRLSDADAVFICVPSPLGRNREPDLSHIDAVARVVSEVARPGQLICLESTTYPGTTEDYIVPAVEKAGLVIDEDVWVAYSPERVSPGSGMATRQIPKVVGGVTQESGLVAAAAYRRLVPDVHLVSSPGAAEMTKLLENTYRAVNIGLINEVAQLSHQLGIDVWEVIDAAATKPFGFQPFYPGPGVGGHCIPLDPQYLAWKARAANIPTRFISTAEEINRHMPDYVVSRIAELLNESGKAIRGSRILVVGIAYKPDVSDDRESASLDTARKLLDRGASVTVLDPLVGAERVASHGFDFAGSDLGEYDLAVVLTDHSALDYERISRAATHVFDTRGVYRRLGIGSGSIVPL